MCSPCTYTHTHTPHTHTHTTHTTHTPHAHAHTSSTYVPQLQSVTVLPHVLPLTDKGADTSCGVIPNFPLSSTLCVPLCGLPQHPPCNGKECPPCHFSQHHHLMALQDTEGPAVWVGGSTRLVNSREWDETDLKRYMGWSVCKHVVYTGIKVAG